MRRIPALLTLVLVSCSGSGESDRGVFRNYLSEEPQSLDPAFAVDQSSGTLTSLIYPGLFRFDVDGHPQPDLVARWDLDEAGMRYTFHLRGDRRFDDGSPLGAREVEACFRRLLDPRKPSPRRWVLERLRGAEPYRRGESAELAGLAVLDDSTLVLSLDAPFSPFLGLLAMPATRVCPLDGDGQPRQREGLPVCGGPWRLAAWERGHRLFLERREAPVHPQGGEFRALEYRVIPQPFTAMAEFEVGNLDLQRVPLAEANYWLEGPWRDRVLRQEELVVSYIGLNVQKPPFDDLRVREALNCALDVQALIRTIRVRAAVRSLGPVPPALRDSDPAEPFRFRPELARELLAAAGYPEGFSMEIWQKENPEVSRLLEAVQAYLAEVGVRVSIVVRDWGAFKDAINRGSADAFFLDWLADYPDAENFLVPLFHSSNLGGGGNRCGYRNSYVDMLLDELQASPPGLARRRLVDRINETLYREAPWIWLWHPVSLQVLQPDIEGYRPPLIFNGQDFLDARRHVVLPDP